MPARTIELTLAKTAHMAAGNRIVVRDDDDKSVEVVSAPRGRVAYDRRVGRGGASSISFGSLTKTVLILRGSQSTLDQIFRGVTGVDP